MQAAQTPCDAGAKAWKHAEHTLSKQCNMLPCTFDVIFIHIILLPSSI
jgi:hypothetical protein